MKQSERQELAAILTDLYQVKGVLRTSTVSFCRDRLEESIARLERLLGDPQITKE